MLALTGLGPAGAAVETMVFDEIDAGIGGKVARRVGERLRALGERPAGDLHHPPAPGRLAGGARTSGSTRRPSGSATVATVERVGGEELVAEIVRMLGADGGDEAADGTRASCSPPESARGAALSPERVGGAPRSPLSSSDNRGVRSPASGRFRLSRRDGRSESTRACGTPAIDGAGALRASGPRTSSSGSRGRDRRHRPRRPRPDRGRGPRRLRRRRRAQQPRQLDRPLPERRAAAAGPRRRAARRRRSTPTCSSCSTTATAIELEGGADRCAGRSGSPRAQRLTLGADGGAARGPAAA